MLTPTLILAAILTLLPLLAAAFFTPTLSTRTHSLPLPARLFLPALLSIPYLLVTLPTGDFRWPWLALYTLLPIAVAALLTQAARLDPNQRSNWRDFLVLAVLGLAVDLRWFEPAWPPNLAVFNKMLLLDTGIYGFLCIRRLEGVGFDLRLRLRDAAIGLREFALYAPIAIALGLALGFLHFHPTWPRPTQLAEAYLYTFLFIAIPEELFFRGWLQNLLQRRFARASAHRFARFNAGRTPALILTAILFGLSHFNKRAAYFNWRYVLLAAIAGIFYGRAWRANHRIAASAITHATVDTLWSLWLR